MFDISRFIVQILESTIYVYIAYQLLNRKVTFKTAVIIGSILAVYWSYIYLVNIGIIKSLLLYRILMLLMIYIVIRTDILKVFIVVFVTLNVSVMIEYSSFTVISIILDIPIQSYSDKYIYAMVFLISFIIGYIFYLILKKYNLYLFDSSKKYFAIERMLSLNNKNFTRIKEVFNDYIIIILIVVLQMTLVTYYFYVEFFELLNETKNLTNVELKSILLGIVLLFLNILTLFMVKKVQKARDEIYYNRINKIEYLQIEKENSMARQYKHDLNNHFTLLCDLVDEKKYDEVRNYLAMYKEDIMTNSNIRVETGLNELNLLLYSKINRAQQSNITINCKSHANIQCDKEHIIDLISIISNLLDNAIEASEKSKNKKISIFIDEGKVYYYFTIKNAVENKVITEAATILQEGFTTKGSGRGLGLKIVDRLVKKYDGNIEINSDEKFFEIKVILPKHELDSN